MRSVVAFLALFCLNNVNGQGKISKETKEQVVEFLDSFIDAVDNGDSIWIRNHSNEKTYAFVVQYTESFRLSKPKQMLIEKLRMKKTFKENNMSVVVTFGRYKETTDYLGGAAEIAKIQGDWVMVKYKCRHL